MCDKNCLAVVGISAVCCCKFGCSAEKTRAAFAFLPPEPSYVIKNVDENKGRIEYTIRELIEHEKYRKAAEIADVFWVCSRKGSRIPLVWLQRDKCHQGARQQLSSTRENTLVLLFCHGNATDIGIMMGPYLELAAIHAIDVVGVEYSGYGAAEGNVHTSNPPADMIAVYDFVVSQGVPAGNIIAYGQSIGSHPACYLAAKRRIGGLILHSPFASGLKVIDPYPDSCCRPSCVLCCLDVFKNDNIIHRVSCPVLIMHGEQDEVVPIHSAQILYDKCRQDSRWPAYFLRNAGHNNLIETDVQGYHERVLSFLQDIQDHRGPPPVAYRPGQLEMTVPFQEKEQQQEGANNASASTLGKKIHAAAEVSEPNVGPDDGRYEQARQGNLFM